MTTDDDVRPLLARLMLAYGQRYGQTAETAGDLVATWARTLAECDPRDVAHAVDEWVRTQKRWPVPSEIRADAWAIAGRRRPAPASDTTFCRRCHTRDLVELANGRLMPYHADNCEGLHESDRLELRHAVETGRAVWRNGAGSLKPKESAA